MSLKILIVDTETTGLINAEPAPKLLEVAACLYHVESKAELATVQFLLYADSNPASEINGIKEESLAAVSPEIPGMDSLSKSVMSSAQSLWDSADFIVAHNASFDRHFLDPVFGVKSPKTWRCSLRHITFPKAKKAKALGYMAVDHGIFPFGAHRALNDVTVLTALLKTVPDLAEQLARDPVENFRFEARDLPFSLNTEAKDRGFRWDSKSRVWYRNMTLKESKDIPFNIVQVPLSHS